MDRHCGCGDAWDHLFAAGMDGKNRNGIFAAALLPVPWKGRAGADEDVLETCAI